MIRLLQPLHENTKVLIIAQLGSNWNNSDNAGSFYWNCNNNPGNRNYNIGSRLLNAL